MPSRKKAKGKARKAAKEAKSKAKAEEEESRAVVGAANQRQGESVEAQMQRLRVSDSSPTICGHGLVPPSAEAMICDKFIDTFFTAFCSQQTVGPAFITAYHATRDKYANVYASKFQLDMVISILLCNGTQCILDGNSHRAQLYACIASFCEDATSDKQSIPCCATVELESADDHTLVSYYRKRIPCSCLDEKYKKVKSVKKMGLCCNPSCSLPGRKAERSKMFSCTRCGEANYCSSECQRADWKKHKQFCGTSFNSEQS